MRRLVPVTLAAAMLAGCGSTAGQEPATVDLAAPAGKSCGPAVEASVLRGGAILDFEALSLPELVAESPLVVTGTVHGFTKGRDLVVSDTRERSAVLTVDVDTVHKGEEYVHDGRVYVVVWRGIEAITEDGRPDREPGAPSTITSIEELAAAAPAGGRVAVLGRPATGPPDPDPGHPADATPISWLPQGLNLEDGATCAVVSPHYDWGPGLVDFDEFAQRLAALAPPENR